jgi:hypothetical protein
MFRVIIYILFLLILMSQCMGQTSGSIVRVEYNSGTRTFRQQVIATPDSLISIEEDFRIHLKPVIKGRALSDEEWNALTGKLGRVQLSEIDELKSPTNRRTVDAAAHGSLIITTSDKKSFTHGFDDQEPHEILQPLLTELLKLKK